MAVLAFLMAPPAGALEPGEQNAAAKNAAEAKTLSEQRAAGIAQVEASGPVKAASERNENVFVRAGWIRML
jgi:hypothetical protein